MDKCMKDDSKLMLEKAMQHKLTNFDDELCAEMWNTLFPLSGAMRRHLRHLRHLLLADLRC